MQINNQYNYNLNFTGYKVANIKRCVGNNITSIDIYKLCSEDKSFIEKLLKKIDYKKLCPQLKEIEQKRWQKIFNYCIEQFKEIESKTYLAVSDSKPCGILTFSGNKDLHLDGICSIPYQEGKKVPFVGKSLFLQLFKTANESQTKSIKLEAVTDGPYDVIKKYKDLGFKQNGCSTIGYVEMSSNKYNIAKQETTLSREFEYTRISPLKVDLNRFID